MAKIKIGISGGHNADNPNKSPDGTVKEWEINEKIKLKIKKRLENSGIIFIDMNPSRYGHTLKSRAKIANDNNVNAVYAVHCNAMSYKWGTHGGIETFAHPKAPAVGGKLLAQFTHNELIKGTKLSDRGVKYVAYDILAYCNAPSALGEMAFMDNKKEATLLLTDMYQEECAEEISIGLCRYVKVDYIPLSNIDYKEKYNQLKEIHLSTKNELKTADLLNEKFRKYISTQSKEMDYVYRTYK